MMKSLLSRLLRSAFLLCLFWATLAQAESFDHGAWDNLLERHVQVLRGGWRPQWTMPAWRASMRF